ncbi:ABC transporter substrate-binding protein [Longivirga aurantiaca]|uniref:ABC transporter substrate-binding protein n=1 Tax=Longivirga aurantiaca TaxID=1837743 RepID=A0ABW1SXI5_9ACTN
MVFGTNTELSGDYQVYGVPAAQGLDEAAKDINAAGGVKVGDQTCEFVAVNVDNKSDPAEVLTASQKVVDAKALAALGPDFSGDVAYETWKKAGIIDWVTSSDMIERLRTDPENSPLMLSLLAFQDLQHIAYMAQAKASAPDIKTVAMLLPNGAVTDAWVDDYTKGAEANGMQVVNTTLFPPDTQDYSTFLTKVAASKPDLLIVGTSAEQSTGIMSQAVPMNVAKYYMSETASAESVEALPELASATVFLPAFAPTFSASATLPTDDVTAIFPDGKAPLVAAAAIVLYYAAWLTKQAVETAGSTDPQAVMDALVGSSYDGPFGTCSITEEKYMSCPTVFTVLKGGDVTVFQFAGPFETAPMAVFDCADATCKER